MIKNVLMLFAFPKLFRFQYRINCHPTKPFHENRPLYSSRHGPVFDKPEMAPRAAPRPLEASRRQPYDATVQLLARGDFRLRARRFAGCIS
jgi:hypothetical protein